MISFWVHEGGAFGIENYLTKRGSPIRELFTVRRYDWQDSLVVGAGPQVFAGLDQLRPVELEAVASLCDQLTRLQPGVPVLNDPRRCLFRFELLRQLAVEGLNDFHVYRIAEAHQVERFPVFVRETARHSGSLTRRLGSAAELGSALRSLRVRGYRPADLMIVEYCDTSDRHGIFRKYSAFKVGDALVTTHLMTSKKWVVKSDTVERSVEFSLEERAYAEQNPYTDWLRRVFTVAGVDYGRIDFGVWNGRPQGWEINLNPTIGRGPGVPAREEDPAMVAVRDETRELTHSNLRNAFIALDRPELQGTLQLRLDPSLLQKLAQASTRADPRETLLGVVRRIYHHPRVGAPFRALFDRFFPLP